MTLCTTMISLFSYAFQCWCFLLVQSSFSVIVYSRVYIVYSCVTAVMKLLPLALWIDEWMKCLENICLVLFVMFDEI